MGKFSHMRLSDDNYIDECEGFKCEQCDNISSTKTYLKTHTQRRLEGLKYPCSHCECRTALKSDLKAHIKHKHEGKKFL